MRREYLGDKYSDIWTDEELCEIFDWINARWKERCWWDATLSIGLAICSGARRMDFVGRDKYPKEGLRVHQCRTIHYPQLVIPNGKGNRRDGGRGKLRYVDIVPEFGPKFRQRIGQYRAINRIFVFQKKDDRHEAMSTTNINAIWREAFDDMGVRRHYTTPKGKRKPMSFRAARRTFASYARLLRYQDDEGNTHQITLEDLQAQLGHSNITVTATHYLRSLPGSRWAPRKLQWPNHI